MSRKLTWPIALGLAFGIFTNAACNDEKGGVTEAEFVAAANVAAEASILTPDDVPADWRNEPDEPEDDAESGLSGDCAYLDQVEDGLPGQVAVAEGLALIGPTHEVNTEASVFKTDDDADGVLMRYVDTILSCKDEIIEIARSQGEQGTDDRFDIEELGAPDIGDNARVIRYDLADGALSITVDFLLVRQGRIVMFFAWGGSAPDDAARDNYVEIQAEKGRRANEALPDY